MAHSTFQRHFLRTTALLLAPVLVASALALTIAVTPAYAATNRITAENSLPGSPASQWDINGAGDLTLQGFATKMSVAPGERVDFKIDDTTGTTAPAGYRVDIYRLGYYGGDGARLVGSIAPADITQPVQPACTLTDPVGARLLDCGNWAVTASWQVPSGAVSGIYIARPTRTADGTKASHIVFVVRDDSGHSNILVQTSDTTWQAYNPYGGYNAYYTANGVDGNAWKLSYNRPFTTRGGELENWLFNAEYPMLSWLERNGYDVSYTTHIDTGLHPERLLDHKVFMSSGHDEYWSQAQRDSVENARAHGVNLAFFSGNEVYWRIRNEDSSFGVSGDQRTMVVYKEGSLAPSSEGEHRRCYMNFSCDPTGEWTGLWRESTDDGLTSTIGSPENALTGQISWRDGTSDITVPSDYASLRFWRNTNVATLTGDQSVTLASGTLGYEWSPQYEQYMGWYPAGRVLLSSTTAVSSFAGVDQHHLSLYRASSGALVFGAGTVQWAWGLDSYHDRANTQTDSSPDPNMQQATVNLLADMGAQPATLQTGLVAASKSTDTTAPAVTITSPGGGTSVPAGPVTVTGTASDTGGAVGVVEVSTDGAVWRPATGRATWSYTFIAAPGATTIHVRAADDSANLGAEVTRSITVTARICAQSSPCSIFTAAPVYVQDSDNSSIEVGVKFRSSTAGYITGVRFYKTPGNTGTHTGSLWSAAGTNLASAVFSGESGTGWQEVTFGAPVAIAANTTYVASYHAPNGHYAAGDRFTFASVDNPPLSALQDDVNGPNGPNGVYKLSSSPAFPTEAYAQSNYLVDVLFTTTVGADTTGPVITGRTPAPGATGLALGTAVTIGFNEGVDPSSVTATSVRLYASGSSTDVTATRTVNGSTVTLTPAAPLAAGTVYTVSISTAVTDLVGNPIQTPDSWTFTTTTTFTNTPVPTISGSAQVGSTLTATLPPWTPAATSVSWQWYADDVAIGGATTSSLTLTSAQLGALVTVRATGHASGLTDQTRVSLPTAAVTQPQVTAGTVSITGTAVVGGTLTANPGSWAPAGVSLAYQWRRGGSPITGATSATYHPVAADVGQTLTVAVTGTKTGYGSATAVSAATAAVQEAVSALAYEAFVKASYQDFLGRQPTAGELTTKTTALASGTVSKESYLTDLTTSNEWLAAIVTKMYKDTLNRDPDPAGLAGWVSWLRSGRFTVAEVASRFYSSDEYYQVSANSNTSTWVTLLYQKLLNRDPDAAGLAYWISLTNDPRYGRTWVAYNFYQSVESRMKRVQSLYQTLLNREPDPTGWPFWTATVLQTGDLVLATQIAGSQEYWDRAHIRY